MSLMTHEEREIVVAFLAAVNRLPNAMRQTLAERQWAAIALTANEYIYTPAQGIGQVNAALITPQYSQQVMYHSIVAVVPAGATGLIQLGSLTIPVSAGPTVITPVEMQLGPGDTRSLVLATAAGPSLLWLTGQQLPTSGVLAP